MGTSPAEVIQRAEALDPAEWAGALALLESANRAERSDELEFALAGLRHRTYERVAATPSIFPAATRGTSPATGDSGLPETTLAELNAADLRSAILDHGSLLVRGAIGPGRARQLADSIDRCFSASEAWSASRQDPERHRTPWYYPFQPEASDRADKFPLGMRKWVRAAGGILLCDSPRMQSDLLDLFRELGLHAIVSEYLGSRPVLSAKKCTLRRVPLDATGGWHQDGAFLGSGIRALNIWLTLTDCGVDAPGLEIVPRRFGEIVETGTGGTYFDWAVGPEVVERVAGDVGVVRPQFDAGDLLLFDDLLLHRTVVEPEMTRERHAIETWCFAADAYPSGQVPLVW